MIFRWIGYLGRRSRVEGFENNVLAFTETESKTAKLNLNTASALQDLKLKFTLVIRNLRA